MYCILRVIFLVCVSIHSSVGKNSQDNSEIKEFDHKAKEWFEKAAALGDAYSMSQLGYMHLVGKGVH